MRYVFVSDIHGRYDKLAKALAEAQFAPETDTLVCLGDIFDRGDQSWEVLQYIMGLPNRILIWGNHDFRLRELMLGKTVGGHDYSNGVLETMHSFCPELKSMNSIDMIIYLFQTDDRYKTKYELLWKYFNECVWAVEWDNLIATHGWVPHIRKIVNTKMGRVVEEKMIAMNGWPGATREQWYNASWAHTEWCIRDKIFPDKPLIVGHWHAWRLHCAFNGCDYHNAPFTTFVGEFDGHKVICIDGCSNAEQGIVNTCVFLNSKEPIKYEAR